MGRLFQSGLFFRGQTHIYLDYGPGYRVYYAMVGRTCVLLLCGGGKRRQSRDINHAVRHLKDYKRRIGKQ